MLQQVVRKSSRLFLSVGRLCADVRCLRATSDFSSGSKPPKPDSTPPKSDFKTPRAAASSKDKNQTAPPTERGDNYQAGELYYSFQKYSFYDLDTEMKSHRLQQPSSGKRES